MKIDNLGQLKKDVRRLQDELQKKNRENDDLRQKNLFLNCLFNRIDEKLIVIDHDFKIHDANVAFLKFHGLGKAEALDKKCYEIKCHFNHPCDECPLRKIRETGQRESVKCRYEYETNDGKKMLSVIYPIPDKGYKSEFFLILSRDITEYKNLIDRVKASKKKFKAILDSATDAILSVDSEYKIILFNNAAQKIFGYSRREILGQDLRTLISDRDGRQYNYLKKLTNIMSPNRRGKTISLIATRKDGNEFPVEAGFSCHEINGDFTFTAILRDLTEQKKMEKKLLQTERLAAVGQTVAHVAHEIKTPLMIIGGFSRQIRNDLTNKKNLTKLDMVLDEVSRLERLITSLSDFTKEYRLVIRLADINLVILDVLKIMKDVYPSEKCHFDINLETDLEAVSCDPDKLKQVFMNIIANGMEAIEDGGKIIVRTIKRREHLEVIIQDNGKGIEEEDLLRIFDPFYTTRRNGSGLGLSISYRIVQAHKGEIHAVSVPEQGTTFIIRLPFRQQNLS
jgi:two-component system sensor kinase FixL